MLARNLGAPWTLEEEERLYIATGQGLSVAEIATAHGRTTGGVKARQQRMGLRDEARKLISPLPPFRSAIGAKAGGEAAPPRAPRPVAAAASEGPPPGHESFSHGGDWIETLWNALRHDAAMLKTGRQSQALAERAIAVGLARLTPADDLHPAATLSELGVIHGVSRERIRQVEVQTHRRLLARVRRIDSLTGQALEAMIDTRPPDEAAPQSWFASELAGRGCRTAFIEFMLLALLGRRGVAARNARALVEEAMGAIAALRRAEASENRRLRQEGDITERARKADAFVLAILKRAVWPPRLNARPVDLSGVKPLRDCRYEQPYYSQTLQRLVGYDSMGERRLIRELDLCTVVIEFVEQPLQIDYELDGVGHTYVPDMLIKTDTGLFFVIEIKGRHRLADRKTLAKAKAAERHLGQRGIGYCLTDADGFGLDDLRALTPDSDFTQRLQAIFQRHGSVTRKTFEQAFAHEQRRWAYDQLQATALRDGLDYDARLIERHDGSNRYIFDFRLSRTAVSPPP